MKLKLLKIIGVAAFIWVLTTINRAELLEYMGETHIIVFSGAFFLQYGIYAMKALRWHMFVRSAGIQTSYKQSWNLYNIGVFLANITPGKLGEFGKSAYLTQAGLPKAQAIGIVLLDRCMDVLVIFFLAIASAGILFGWMWFAVGLLIALFCTPLLVWGISSSIVARNTLAMFGLQTFIPSIKNLLVALCITILAWAVYFAWATLVALSVGITVPVHILIAAFTITGILSLLPIAPSGLGTRDIALLHLLAPFGVIAPQAVALSLLMFVSIILSGILGLWYWLHTKTTQQSEFVARPSPRLAVEESAAPLQKVDTQ